MFVWLLALLTPLPASACRYNVRDLGFLDLESEGYQLHIRLAPNTSAQAEAALRKVADASLLGSNIRAAFEQAGQPAPSVGSPETDLPISAAPAAVLVSPDGPRLALPWAGAPDVWSARLAVALHDLVESPTREKLVRMTSRRFGAILLIEGTDAAQNAGARRAATDAIAEVRQSLAALPKRIAEPPGMVALAVPSFPREQVLLWSLGLGLEPTPEPRAAVIYGRARWIGPLMRGPEISVANLARLFSVVGADCECGMDLAWTRGTALPVRWSAVAHQATVKTLGFDPQDPLVQAEAGRLLDRYSSGSAGSRRPESATKTQAAPGHAAAAGAPIAQTGAWFGTLGRVLGFMVLAVLGMCLVLWRRAQRR